MSFELTPLVRVRRDESGKVRHLHHLQAPYLGEGLVRPRIGELTAAYLADVAPFYEWPADTLENVFQPPGDSPRRESTRLRSVDQKSIAGTAVFGFQQTEIGIPVWDAHVTVRVQEDPQRVTSSDNGLHYDVKVKRPTKNATYLPDTDNVYGVVDGMVTKAKGKLVKINRQRLLVYQFARAQRLDPESSQPIGVVEGSGAPTLPLPALPRTIREGQYYVVTEVLFSTNLGPWTRLHWRAMLEVETGAVLYLRAFVSAAFGNVFSADPITLTGNAALDACTAAGTLDPLTDVVTLPGLTPPAAGDPQPLDGEYVTLGELSTPTIAGPEATLPTGNFSFSSPTDDFAAVNTYYHCDALFRLMVEEMGFDLATYFPDTVFPLTVDHRDESLGTVNARGYGNALGNGAGGMGFNLIEAGCDLGISSDLRVVLHEFCHELLWEHVNGPNFGFAHSAGDSLAAILLDPDSQAPDRFLTFPFVPLITRRHDRDVTAGWAWGGTMADNGYQSEEILSTTLFRVYRSVGGDSADLWRREHAASFLAYLIIKAIGMLTATTTDPEVYASALMDSDADTPVFEGVAGGGVHKVIRWSFEQQGLYQPDPPPVPVVGPGDPPDVDVYIDDGRAGEYEFRANFWNTTTIWNRLSTTAGTETDHETPVVGTDNYLFVRVNNRGTQAANGVVVRTYHCVPATGLVWPDDWILTTTGEIAVAGSIPAGGDVIVGPFTWTPQVIGHECLLASVSADGDLANIDAASGLPAATGPSPHWWIVPNDNNIAQRNVAPVPGGGGALALQAAFADRTFIARNPYERPARIELTAELPTLLSQKGWDVVFVNPGAGSFTLPPRGSKEIRLRLKEGADFTAAEVGGESAIEIVSRIDGIVVGGMTYQIDPRLKRPPTETVDPDGRDCDGPAKKLLECLNVPAGDVCRVRIKRIDVSIDLIDDC